MKTLYAQYRLYIRAVLCSVMAAFVIMAIVNFDDIKNSFDKVRGKVSIVAHSTKDSMFKVPEKIAVITGVIYKTVFD